MARIYIDVYPDSTFRTGLMHGDIIQHAAKTPDGVMTFSTDDIGPCGDEFQRLFKRFGSEVVLLSNGRWSGEWQSWGAACIKKWLCWFLPVNADERRQRIPKRPDELERRIIRILTFSPLTSGVIRNRMRAFSAEEVNCALSSMLEKGIASKETRVTEGNGREHHIYSITAQFDVASKVP